MTNEELGKWAVERWNDEVKHRPLENRHRRTLDDTWRQVITKAASHLLPQIGPSHDELLAAERQSKDGFVPRYKEDVGLSHIIKANLADPVALMQEVSAAGYCITPDVITDYQELDRLRMLAQATPTCHVAVGDPVTANQGCYSRHGEVLALIHGMEGGIVALVAHESDVGGGFGYYVYDAKQVQKNTGKTLRQKAERYEDLCRMEGEFDLTYENWRVLVPVTDAVREVEGLDHLMDKLAEDLGGEDEE